MESFNRGNRRNNRGSNHRGYRNRAYGGRQKSGGDVSPGYKRHHNDSYRNKKFHGGDKFNKDKPHNNSGSMFPSFNAEVLCETEIGVTEYISDHEGFSGIIKARYCDFHVNEIDQDGVVAKLTSKAIPKDPVKVIDEDDEDLLHRYCYEHLPIETWDRIHALVQKPGTSKETIDIDVSTKTKEERTKIHESVKLVFGAKVVGSTVVRDGVKYVSFMKYDKNARIDRREQWPKERGGDYVHFLVYKEHYDTLEAAMRIAEALRIKPSMLSYAGTKDRRGITTQWFCVKRIDPTVLSEKCKKLCNIHIGNYCYKKQVLKLGCLKGNRFRIALRNVTATDDVITKAVDALKNKGFLNYYGLQRFGNSAEVPTYEIGKQLLKGNWKEACNLILKPRKFETDRYVGHAKKIYETSRDTKRALSAFGPNRDRTIEGKLLQGLQKHHENDLVNALEFVPRNMRLLYIHAYQSFVWNQVLSRRIKEFGLRPIVGDLVLLDPEINLSELQTEDDDKLETDDKNENESQTETPESEIKHTTASESENGGGGVTDKVDDKPTVDGETKRHSIDDRRDPKANVKILTEEDLSNYTIYDIVLPMPGFGVQYPHNVIRDWYRELLESDGLELEMTKIKVRTYCVSGTYRKCVERADNLTWEVITYRDPLRPVILSDYEEMKQKPVPISVEGPFKALILDFNLPSASYATMALREILKTDTSSAAHAKLNDYYGKNKRKNTDSADDTESGDTKKIKSTDESNKTDDGNTEKTDDDTSLVIKKEDTTEINVKMEGVEEDNDKNQEGSKEDTSNSVKRKLEDNDADTKKIKIDDEQNDNTK